MLQVIEMQVDEVRYAVPLERVVEVAGRVAITSLAGLDAPLVGYVSCRGEPVPVVDLRLRLGRPAAAPRLDQHLLIALCRRRGSDTVRPVALLVDRVLEVGEVDPDQASPPPTGSVAVAGLLALPDGLLLVADLDRMLSLAEERAVDAALNRLPEGD